MEVSPIGYLECIPLSTRVETLGSSPPLAMPPFARASWPVFPGGMIATFTCTPCRLVPGDVASENDARSAVFELNRFFLASLLDMQVDVLGLYRVLCKKSDRGNIEFQPYRPTAAPRPDQSAPALASS